MLAGLLQLVTLDEHGRPIRRRVDRAGLAEPVRRELDAFVDYRLLTVDVEGRTEWIGVSHEAVLSSWAPLAQAIRDAATALRARQTVEQAAADWTQAGRRDAYLWERDRILAATALLAAPCPPPGRRPPSPSLVSSSADEGTSRLTPSMVCRSKVRCRSARSAPPFCTPDCSGPKPPSDEAARATDPRTALLLGIAALRIQDSPETQTSLVSTLTTTHYAGVLTGHKGSVSDVATPRTGGPWPPAAETAK